MVYTVLNTIEEGIGLQGYVFGAVYFSLSVGVEQTDHLTILIYIYYFVGNVSDCGDTSGRNSAFDDGCL